MATPLIPVETGRVLGARYRVGPRLGGGGMADVFLGQDGRLDREVAIKVLRPEARADPGIRRRFATEGRAAARLSHPNVVGVYDVGEDGGNPYLIMELVSGGTLAERIRSGLLPEDVVRRAGLDILAGLGATHAAGVLHRDVKPSNVLIGVDGSAKLADFGIAKSDQPGDGEATATAMVIGTPSYLAPERAAGAPAGVASDLWAVGVVLYEALTGAKPFQGPTPLAAALAARNGDCVPLQVHRPGVDPALAATVHRVLSPNPAARYPSATAMAQALQNASGWGSAAEAAPAMVASAAVDPTAAFLPLPTEILEPDAAVSRFAEHRTKRTATRLAVGSGLVVVALLLAWAVVAGGLGSATHPGSTTTVPAQVTTTLAVTTTTPTTTTPTTTAPTTQPTITAAPSAHHGGGGDHGNGNGGNGNGDH